MVLAALGVLNAGWYSIPKARLYETVDGRSGAIFALGTAGEMLPLVLGLVVGAAGLATALWIPLLAPVGLVIWLPRGDG